MYCYDSETKKHSSQWKHAGSPRPEKARHSKSTNNILMMPFFESTGIIYMHWVPTGQTVNKEYYVEVLREFRKRFRRNSPALSKSGQWHFHQDNAPFLNSILVTDYLIKMGINKGDERGCNEDHLHAQTIGLPSTLPEVVETVQQVHCSRRRLLRRGLEFHVCTAIKVPIQKKSGNVLCAPCIFLYIYLHIYTYVYVFLYLYVYLFM